MGAAWARHAMCESAFRVPLSIINPISKTGLRDDRPSSDRQLLCIVTGITHNLRLKRLTFRRTDLSRSSGARSVPFTLGPPFALCTRRRRHSLHALGYQRETTHIFQRINRVTATTIRSI